VCFECDRKPFKGINQSPFYPHDKASIISRPRSVRSHLSSIDSPLISPPSPLLA
jgi:hypothetical protein